MAKVRQILIGSIFSVLSLSVAAQTVYSWQDAKGVVHFSQQPPAQGEYQLVTIRTSQAASAPALTAGTVNAEQAAAVALDPTLCQQARDQLTLLQSSQELFTKEANSEELRLLTSEEREQQILLANFEIKRRCPAAP